MEAALKVSGLSKRYRDFSLADLSFELPRGEVMGFIGPNGAGKTTTIKAIMGLVRPDAGNVEILGMDVRTRSREARERIGFVYDEAFLNEELNAREIGLIVSGLYSRWDGKAYRDHLARFELREQQKISEYSKGMKVKLLLAIALSHNAELILMDEPTSGLDPVFRSRFLDELFSFIQDEEKSVFFSTHITEDLSRIADRITLIDHGKMIFSSQKDELADRYRILKGSAADLSADLRAMCLGARVSDASFTALTDADERRVRALCQSVVVERPTLDDIMIYLTREDYRV